MPNHAVAWPEGSPLLVLSALLSGVVQNGKQTPNLEGACSFLGKSRMLPHPHSCFVGVSCSRWFSGGENVKLGGSMSVSCRGYRGLVRRL